MTATPIHLARAAMLSALIAIAPVATDASAEGPALDDADAVPLWTDRPVRVDPSKQDYERLPSAVVIDPHLAGITVPDHVRVLDSARFSIGRTVFAMRDVTGIPTRKVCRKADGSRWACGRMAAIFLGNLVRSRRMLCDESDAGAMTRPGLVVADCEAKGKRIALEVVRAGFAMAGSDPELQAAEESARRDGKGIWSDPQCLSRSGAC